MTNGTLPFAPDALADSAASDALRAEVREVVRGLGRALRAYLLYEGTGPSLERFMEALQGRVAALWERTGHLTLAVDEHDLLWEGGTVYEAADDRSEDLAFLLFKDGIREITLFAGFEESELAVLVDLLARVHRVRSDEEDLLTLFWDRDWAHFRYRYVEPLNEGVQLPAASGGVVGPVAPPREEEPEAALTTISRDDFREALYFLDEDELRILEGEMRLEAARDLWGDVLNALLDRLQDGAAERQAQVVTILTDLLPTLLAARRLDTSAYILGELVGLATSPERPLGPGPMRALRALFEQLGQPQTVQELIRIVEEAGEGVSEASLGALFAYFPPDALASLLRAAETVQAPGARRAVQAAAERLGAQSHDHLIRLLADEEAAVAGGAARLLARLRVTAAAGEVGKLLRRPQVALRVAAVEALQELRAPSAAGALEGALEDAEREVRVAAARALAEIGFTPARSTLEAALDSKRLREADLTERIAFFEAYGVLAGEGGVALLDRILNGKSWLGRREMPEMRACAALGLGRIRHASAERALTAAAAEADPVVRSAVGRALRTVKT